MSTNKKRQLLRGLLAGGLALGACSHPDNALPKVKDKVSGIAYGPVEDRLYLDIVTAQQIEKHELGAQRPDEPINRSYGTDSAHTDYHFPNLRALRIDIKHRMDSLRAAGVVLSYDTISAGPVVHGVLREYSPDTVTMRKRLLNGKN